MKRKLRVPLLMIEPPLPFGNAAARWFYVLFKGLVDRGHDVTAFATCAKPDELAKARELFPKPRYDLRIYPNPARGGLRSKLETLRRPYSYMFSPELERDLRRELDRGFDVFHIEQLWAGWLGLDYAKRSLLNVHHLVGIDLEQVRPRGLRARYEKSAMVGTEHKLLRSYSHIRACTPRLEQAIHEINPGARVTTAPVALDPAQYRYIPDPERRGDPVVSVIGSLTWHPTRSAAERFLKRLWPEIKRRVPRARAQIVGWNARAMLAEYLHLPDLTVEENVPDILPYFQNTSVLLYAPARGSGMKIKVLEAMAFGVPVVTTSEGVEGIPARDSVEAGVSEDDAGLIERAVALLEDPGLQNRQRAAARALVESHCSPERTLDQIEAIYEGML